MKEIKISNLQTTEKVLTSLEVAEMVGKEHGKVIRDIRKIMEHLGEAKIGLGTYFIDSTYSDVNNQSRPMFLLTKKGCELYSTRMTGSKGTIFAVAYIERFNDMEESLKKKHNIPETYIGALEQLIESEKEKERLLLENEILKPDAEFTQEYINIDDEKGLLSDTVAKKLGLTANVLNSILLKQKFIRKSGSSYTMMQNHAMKGYETYSEYKNHFTEIVYKNIRWTHKGEKKIFEILKNLGYVMPDEVSYRYNEYGIKEISECYGLKYSDINNILELEGVIKKGKQGYKLTDEFSNLGYKNNTKWTEHGKRLIQGIMEKHQKV